MFPVDTMKTHMQVHTREAPATLYELVRSCGAPRLWRGVQTMFAGAQPSSPPPQCLVRVHATARVQAASQRTRRTFLCTRAASRC